MRTLSLLFISSILLSCSKEETPDVTDYLFNKTFENGLKIDGHEFDSLVIENCTFHNKSLRLGNVKNVTIRNCTFEDISFDGIKIGFIGDASNIIVDGCTFKNIGYNGIDSHERALNCTIKNCHFENVALSEVGAAMGQPHHGIYWKGKNVLITGNTFLNGDQPFGNAISVRSSGVVSKNTIRNAVKNGIMYYANHPGSDSLIIENNFITNSSFYSIIMGSDGNLSNHNQNVIIRFNSCAQTENESIYISESFETTTHISIYGNVLVNPTGEYYKTFFTVNDVHSNLTNTSDIGFINIENGDLHILPTSAANGFCNGLSDFPTTDIDGETRTTTNLDAGADEIN